MTTRRGLRARLRAGCVAPVLLLAGCAASPAPVARGLVDDFDAPRPAAVASLLGAAAHREARGDLEGALQVAERAHRAAPASGAAALREAELRAWVAHRAGDTTGLAEARAEVEGIVERHPDAPLPRLALARLELASGERDAAEARAKALVEERPTWAAPHALLARIVLDDDPQRALTLATRAVERAPSDPEALASRALAEAAFARDGAAAEDARRALLSRYDPDLVRILAEGRLRSGDVRGAAARIERTLEAERTVDLEILLAHLEALLGDAAGAERAVARAKKLAGDDPEARVDALEGSLDLAIAQKRTAEALAEIQTARAGAPDDARLAELAALVELELGRLAAAAASARRSIELAPERRSAWIALARVLDREGVRPPAYARARAVLGPDAYAHALAAILAASHQDRAAARLEYEAALAADPHLAIAQLGLAEQLLDSDATRALALAEQARAQMGWNVATAQALGGALRANRRPAEAVEAYEIGVAQAVPGSGASQTLLVGLAFALAEAGEREAALRLTGRLLSVGGQIDPPPAWVAGVRDLRAKLAPVKPAAPPPHSSPGGDR